MPPFFSSNLSVLRAAGVGLTSLALLMTSCAYPGGHDGLVDVRRFGTRTNVKVDSEEVSKRVAFALASRDKKFHYSVAHNDAAVAAKYVTEENVNQKLKGVAPIAFAVVKGNAEMVEMLAANGADMKVETNGRSLAYVAAASGHAQLADRLVTLGGGSRSDVRGGKAAYASLREERRQKAARNVAAAAEVLRWLSSGSGGGEKKGDGVRCQHCGGQGWTQPMMHTCIHCGGDGIQGGGPQGSSYFLFN